MPLVTIALPDADRRTPAASGYLGDDAADLLWSLGVACGHWPAARQPSSLPHLRHARALADLKRRFPTTRVRWLRGATEATDGQPRMRPHGEVHVALQGSWRVEIAAVLFSAPVQVTLGELEWIALPAWLPHTVRALTGDAHAAGGEATAERLVLELGSEILRRADRGVAVGRARDAGRRTATVDACEQRACVETAAGALAS